MGRGGSPLRTVVVDDERPARRQLLKLLADLDDVEVVAEADSGPGAVEAIREHEPDLVFLDIDLPGFDGFTVLQKVDPPPPVVFTTAHERFALKAFEASGVDYLLKPIDRPDLDRALRKLRHFIDAGQRGELEQRLQKLLQQWEPSAQPTRHLERLPVRIGERILILDVTEITHFEAEEKYVYLHTLGGKRYIVNFTLAQLEEQLDPRRFVRVHRSTLVNVDLIDEIQVWFGGKYRLVLRDKDRSRLTVSKGMARNLREIVPF
jgi:two-component system, LytTR family, response regulator